MHSSKVYVQLSERMGLHDHLMVMNLTVTKITMNLKSFAQCHKVVESSLNLLQDLAVGFMSGFFGLDAINQTLLVAHTPDHFPFLAQYANTRNRTIFYATLGSLLVHGGQRREVPRVHGAARRFVHSVWRRPTRTPSSTHEVKHTLIGLFRDLRGIASAAN